MAIRLLMKCAGVRARSTAARSASRSRPKMRLAMKNSRTTFVAATKTDGRRIAHSVNGSTFRKRAVT